MQRYPWPLFVYPTRHCNYRCSYCFTESAPSEPVGSFVLDHWEELLDGASAAGVPELRLSGGEPLTIPQIEIMCRAIAGRGMRFTITTNGSLLRRHLRWLREIAPETLWLSFHREYVSVETFVGLASLAVSELPRVGLNVFATDWTDAFATIGAARIKLLSQSAVGRSESTAADVYVAPQVAANVEVRSELIEREVGPATCVLRDRPLLSIDHDGRAFACCVTVGHEAARVGDLTLEPLAAILARSTAVLEILPCAALLPAVAEGREGCPVRLYAEP